MLRGFFFGVAMAMGLLGALLFTRTIALEDLLHGNVSAIKKQIVTKFSKHKKAIAYKSIALMGQSSAAVGGEHIGTAAEKIAEARGFSDVTVSSQGKNAAGSLPVENAKLSEVVVQLKSELARSQAMVQKLSERLNGVESGFNSGDRELEERLVKAARQYSACHEENTLLQNRYDEVMREQNDLKNELLLKTTQIEALRNRQDEGDSVGISLPEERRVVERKSEAGISATARALEMLRARKAQAEMNISAENPASQEDSSKGFDVPVVEVMVSAANLRSGPGVDNSTVMTVSQGSRLTVEEKRGEWYRVVTPTGSRAFVRADLVGVVGGAQPGASRAQESSVSGGNSEEEAAFESILDQFRGKH